jgi:hypothetical protein
MPVEEPSTASEADLSFACGYKACAMQKWFVRDIHEAGFGEPIPILRFRIRLAVIVRI